MRYCDTLIMIQRNTGISSTFLVRTQILVKENFSYIERKYLVLDFISDEIKRAVECFPLNGSVRIFLCTI